MHPQLIPEKHPRCGKLMVALIKCREESGWGRYWGACNQIVWDLQNCLVEEKKEFRAPRQAKFQERWNAKKAADAERLAALQATQPKQEENGEANQGAAPSSDAAAASGAAGSSSSNSSLQERSSAQGKGGAQDGAEAGVGARGTSTGQQQGGASQAGRRTYEQPLGQARTG